MIMKTTPESLLNQIAQISRMEPGKLCVIREGPSGPYYNLQHYKDGKTITQYVPSQQVEAATLHTANYQRFTTLVGQYVDLVAATSSAERKALVKKKRTSNPPGPRSRNPRVDEPLPGHQNSRNRGAATGNESAHFHL